MKKQLMLVVFIITTLLSCQKEDNSPSINTSEAPAFHAGKGVRALHIVTAGYFGGVQYSFMTADVALTNDGIVHWCYGLPNNVGESDLHRVSFTLSDGDSVLETGTLKGILASGLNDEKIKYVPYSNMLYSLHSNAAGYGIDGDVHYNLGGDILEFFHPYANGTLSSAGFSGYTPNGSNAISQANAYVQLPGAAVKTQQIYDHLVPDASAYETSRYRLAAFGLDPNNHMIALMISGDSAVAIDMVTSTTLASIPYTGMKTAAFRFSQLARNTMSVTAADGSHMAALYREQLLASAAPTITTLVYNFTTHELKVGIPGIVPAKLSVHQSYLVDLAEDGSVVFPAYDDAATNSGLKIIKQKGTDQSILAAGFLSDGTGVLQYLHATAGEVFVGIATAGATPKKTTNSIAYVLGIIA